MTRDAATTSRIMSAVRNRDTGPELRLRKELHRRGLRYRLHPRVFGRPDLVFPRAKVAVFVDGDYWHGNTWRIRGAKSFDAYFADRAHGDFWRDKISKNMARDEEVNQHLGQAGWRVLRIWESAVQANVENAADQVEHEVRERRGDARRGA
ncbi:very short patch repair endonuclease [Geodermatophilus normandii]|uniref:Very short patch repair endonuclease n=1 Tax=Geodermatophilus normandii TaxID=1137989 RepID=A0A6P0GK53_9ACTN|nr:very short patch repair endonuclease [Geodermatophilus normandii]NEM07735.1 very short patch repair endonuclease [Geodermatophilus normandii]